MKILLADDHEMIRYSLAGILTDEFPGIIIQQVACGQQLQKMANTQKYDIIVADMLMPDKTGLAVLKQLRAQHIQTPILIVSIYPESQYAKRVLRAGGNGYFVKNDTRVNFVAAIQTILSGKKYISDQTLQSMASQLDQSQPTQQTISDRELEILKHIASGKVVSQIATLLSLSISTISTYRQRLLKKLHFKTSAELMHYAILNHLEN